MYNAQTPSTLIHRNLYSKPYGPEIDNVQEQG
jgi:hypothetical protein